jgi:flagellar hook-associated protein 1 FlgK
MPDMLNTAISGLLSFQRALSTTSHNISNVNTEGYSRQRVEIRPQFPAYVGGSYYGNGAMVNSVGRVYDQFLTSELRSTTSVNSKMDMLTNLAGHVDNVLADPVGGISPILHEFFSAVQDVGDDPSSTTARYNMINVANTLTDRFHNIDERFSQLEENTAKDIRTTVDEINNLVENIRQINVDLNKLSAGGTSSQQSSDLLDNRDNLLQQLSEKINITVVNEGTTDLSIFIGNGQTVLNGSKAFTLDAVPNLGDPTQDYIVYNGFSQVTDLTDSLKGGGELGALLEFRDSVLSETRNDLGRVAVALADTFNQQHKEGLDLNNNLGADFFTVNDPQVLTYAGNTGSASIAASVSDVSQLTRYDYTLQYDGAGWTITSDSGTVSAAVADASPADTTIVFEGITLVIDGATNASAVGDRYRIKPTVDGAASLQTLISDPLLIAASTPVRSSSSLNNLGTVAVSAADVTDSGNVNLFDTVTLTLDTPATTLRSTSPVVVGGVAYAAGAAIPFTNGMTVESNGWQVDLSGIPQPGDVLTIEKNNDGQGDNGNALKLANLQNTGILDGGNTNYQEAYSTLVGRVGTQAAAAESQRDASSALLTQARDRKTSLSGVNLDEEAADLIRYQQAYEAASRIISTTQTLFESLLNAVR